MDWLLTTPQIHSVFSSLGSFEGDSYVVNPNALAILEEINYKLTYEDQTLRTYRRAIGFGQNVRSDLIPLLENAKDEDVLDSVIRILVNLTVPVECLFSVDVMYRTEVGRHTIFELNKLLYTSKEAFTDPKSTKSVVEYMKHILESDSKLSSQKCDKINNCLLLLRNILHIPETHGTFIMSQSQANGTHVASMQNAILWNLFIQSIDKLLLYLMTCPQRAFWGVTMVQLIALMYKDQHVSTLQKLLNMWFEASLSESSEDNESNTSPPKCGDLSGDSSPMLTSDPTSDSSDNGSGGRKIESSEDRRHALHEETEATLQEVSRKGHEYQNSILRTPTEGEESKPKTTDKIAIVVTESTNDCEKPCTSAQAAAAAVAVDKKTNNTIKQTTTIKIKNEPMEGTNDDDANLSDVTVMDTIKEETEHECHTKDSTQPAEHVKNTSKTEKTDEDKAIFVPPPPKPFRSTNIHNAAPATKNINVEKEDKLDNLSKSCQKVPHSGQLNLTKGKCCPQKRECPSSQSELSDCGYGTQVENQESISTSSNDDDGPQNKPQHQKPPCNSKPRNKQRAVMTVDDKKELRRKKLVKRSKSNLINMKGLVQHTPTDEDISNLLKEFTVDFLLKGYDYLVEELHSQLLSNMKISIDTSHFFWLVTYFLKFAAQLELDMEHINSILTYDVISYLTYEGVTLCEQLELNSRQEGCDVKPYLRRMHLVVTAIREFLQAIETYKKITHLSEEDREHLRRLQIQISSTEDLRCLFVLLLRRFNPSLHTKQYLQDLVVTNHILLLILDSVTKSDNNSCVKMIDHLAQFATLEVMHYYGMLLEDFSNNGEFVNDCIFTMMHHIGGDLGQIRTLFQPVILKTYSRIWEADYELCDDWSDLIEYVIYKFMNTPQKSALSLPTTSLTELTKEHNLETTVCSWTQEEKDTLYWYYVQSKKNNDIVGKIVKLFSNNGNKQKSRISIIQQLLQQDIITLVEYDDLMKFEDAEYQRNLLTTNTSSTTESGIDIKDAMPSDDIQILRDLIIKENKGKHLIWLQKLLLECCHVKLILKNKVRRENNKNLNLNHTMEPVSYHCILKNKSIPVVQWNNDQAIMMLYQPFVLLLHKLGFQLPADAGSVFARIPDYWTADMMYSLAKKLGPLDKLVIKFDVNQLEEKINLEASTSRCYNTSSSRPSLSSLSSLDIEISDTDHIPVESSDDINEVAILPPLLALDMRFEKAHTNEIFAVGKDKHCNSIIRFTPDPSSTPSVPNWLQLVMRSKCNPPPMVAAVPTLLTVPPNERNDGDFCMPNSRELSAIISSVAATTSHLMTTVATGITHPTTQLPHTSISNIIVTKNKCNDKSCSSNNNSNSKSNSSGIDNNDVVNSGNNDKKSNNTNNSNNNNINDNKLNATTLNIPATIEEHQQEQQQLTQQQLKLLRQSTSSDDDSAMQSFERRDSSSSGFYTRSGCSATMESEYSAMVASVYQNEMANSDSASVASDLTRMYVSDEDEKPEFQVTHFH